MYIPALNIVMAFDSQAIDILKSSQNFETFVEKTQDNLNVVVFGNGPASHFLSLNHEYGWGGGDGGSSVRLELEFIDPESKFESNLLSADLERNMPIEASLASKELDQLQKNYETRKTKQASLKAKKHAFDNPGGNAKPSQAYGERLEEELQISSKATSEAFDELAKFHSVTDAVGGIKNLNKLRLLEQQAAQRSLMQRPVWITYGAGNDFRNWSPVVTFDHAIEMSYNFTGAGVRKLKIVYDGVGISTNLTSLGLSPLKALGIGAVIKGQSNPIFSQEVMEREKKTWDSMVDRADISVRAGGELDRIFGDAFIPSVHKTIIETYTDYIRNGTGWDNVIVAFPNLDELLKNAQSEAFNRALKAINSRAYPTITVGSKQVSLGILVARMLAFKDLVETFGLKLVESLNEGTQTPVGADNLRLEEISKPQDIGRYLLSRTFRVALVSDGYSDILAKDKFRTPLYRSTDKIAHKILEGGQFPNNKMFITEHDYDILHAMANAGMIDDPSKPVLIFGDPYFINKWIYAHIQSEVTPTGEKGRKLKPEYFGEPNVLDQIRGFNTAYTQAIEDIARPVPFTTPFGPTGDQEGVDDYSLTEDTNIIINNFEKLKKADPAKSFKLPIFTLGTKNTNILEINFKIDNQYLSLINKFTYQTLTASQYISAVVPAGKVKACTGLLASIKNLNLKKVGPDGVPIGFRELIEPWIVVTGVSPEGETLTKEPGGGQISTWSAIFAAMGITGTSARERVTTPSLKAFDPNSGRSESWAWDWVDQNKVIAYFWERFKALIQKFPRITIELAGKDVTRSALIHSNMVADGMASHGFTGEMKTLPMFHLANSLRVMSRDALLYAVEPRIMGLSDIKNEEGVAPSDIKYAHTWFSGMYTLVGFRHTISGNSANSNFKFYKAPGRAMSLGGGKE